MLIGLAGYAFAGKDAVADVLEGLGWYRTFLSKPLHEALMVLDPIVSYYSGLTMAPLTYVQIVNKRGYDEAKKLPEVRRLLQVLGTEVGRKMWAETFWLRQIEKELANVPDDKNVAITGIRFRSDYEWVIASGGIPIWVERPGFGPVNNHIGENTLARQDFDHVIINNGTLEELSDRVQYLVELLEFTHAE